MAAARTPRLARPPAGTRVSGGTLRPRRAAVRADAGAAAAAEQSSSANGAPSSAPSSEEERNRAAPAGAVADGVTLSDGYAPSCEVEDYIVDPVLNLSISEEDLGADAVAGMLSGLVTPSWRVMLLSDGSVTRHLKLLTEETVHVELVQQRCVGDDQVNLKVLGNDVNTIPGPHVQREGERRALRDVFVRTHVDARRGTQRARALAPGGEGRGERERCARAVACDCVRARSRAHIVMSGVREC